MAEDTGRTLAIVALVGAVGYGIYRYTTGAAAAGKAAEIEIIRVTLKAKATGATGIIGLGDIVVAEVTYRNNGDTSFAPEFRIDLKPDIIGKTWKESREYTGDEVGQDESATIILESISIPSDWRLWGGGDTLISVKIMIKGVEEEVWGPKFNQGVDVFTIIRGQWAVSGLDVLYVKGD